MANIISKTSEDLQALQNAGLSQSNWGLAAKKNYDNYEDPEFNWTNATIVQGDKRTPLHPTLEIDRDIMQWLQTLDAPAKEYTNNLLRQQMQADCSRPLNTL